MPKTLALLVLIALFLLPLADARAEPAPLDARTVDATVRQLDRRGGGRGGVRARGKRGWGQKGELDLERPVVSMDMRLKARTVTTVSFGSQSRDVINDLLQQGE